MNFSSTSKRRRARRRVHPNRNTFEVRSSHYAFPLSECWLQECIVFTWDYHSSISFWSGLRVQPILADEVQTFKALITVHKVLQEGHPVVSRIWAILSLVNFNTSIQVIKEAHGQTAWLETCARTVGTDNTRGVYPVFALNLDLCFDQGYGPLIKTYVQFILQKLRFHRLRPEFNGLFEYEEYVTLKGIDDPNEGYRYSFSPVICRLT